MTVNLLGCVKGKARKVKGRRGKIPVGGPLKAALDRTPRVATVILTTTNNTAWTEDGFRASWSRACTKADILRRMTRNSDQMLEEIGSLYETKILTIREPF